MVVQLFRNNKPSSMASVLTFLLIGGMLLSLTSARASGRYHSAPKDSFLIIQVNSIKELIDEIDTLPKVRARFERLYHLSEAALIKYFKTNLIIEKLRRNYYHTVYCITPSGIMFTTHELLRTGDKVFALRDGSPVLRWACGNPLTASLPEYKPMIEARALPAKAPAKPSYSTAPRLPALPLNIASNTTNVPANTSTPFEEVSPYVATLPTTPSYFGNPTDFNVPITGGGSGFSFAPFLGLIPVAAIVGSSGGSGSSGAAIPAPEAATTITWLIGAIVLAGVAAAGRRKKPLSDDVPLYQ